MKKLILTMAVVIAAAFIAVPSYAVTYDSGTGATFVAEVNIPLATQVDITASKRLGTNDSDLGTVTALDFDSATGFLNFDSTNNIFVSEYYFVIDVGKISGGGDMVVNTKYTDGADDVLGKRTTAKFYAVTLVADGADADTDPDELETTAGPDYVTLNSLIGSGENVSAAELDGGWFRVYIGVYDGGTPVTGGEVFDTNIAPDTYTGTITVTGTVS